MHHISHNLITFHELDIAFHAFDITQLITTSCVLLTFSAKRFTETMCFRPSEQCHKDCAREIFKHHSFYRQGKTPGIPQRVVRISNRPDARRFKQGNFTLVMLLRVYCPAFKIFKNVCKRKQNVNHFQLLSNLAYFMTPCQSFATSE